MTTINKLLCIIIVLWGIILPGCNTNGNHPVSTSDSATDTTLAADSALRAKYTNVKVDNLNCPVCRKPLLNCVEDTTSYLGKLIGFDNPQCEAKFAYTPDAYTIDYK